MCVRRLSVAGLALLILVCCVARGAVWVELNGTWKFKPGTSEASDPDPTAWRLAGFDDNGWTNAPAPFWYGKAQPSPGTQLTGMRSNYTCVFLRRTFSVTSPDSVTELQLNAASDDGFIAWINGKEVVRFNMPAGDVPYSGLSSAALPETTPWPPLESYSLLNPAGVLQAGNNVLAIQAFNASKTSTDFIINASLEGSSDSTPPTLVEIVPNAASVVRHLLQVEVGFSEAVAHVDAADLLINGVPATDVVTFSPTRFVFHCADPAPGPVQVSWRPTHGITDLADPPNPFAGGGWTYTVDPTLSPPGVILSEFMADNSETLHDEDGDSSDWIELLNTSGASVDLEGWGLTTLTNHAVEWRFPAATLPPSGFLVVFASGKDRANAAGQLHTSFKLNKASGYLALMDPFGEIVSAFTPSYPAQYEDVSFGRDPILTNAVGYFTTPTPGAPNSTSGQGFAPEIEFSRPSGAFLTSFTLTLSTPSPTAVIRYTLDGSAPYEGSPRYTGPLAISTSTQVRARAFDGTLFPGPIESAAYLQLSGSLANFSSDLPVVVLHNFGAGGVPADYDQTAWLMIFEPGGSGRTTLTERPALVSRAGINLRGRSTQGLPKSSLAVELWNEANQDKDRSVLGMPTESDWVLYAPNGFDKPMIHNPLMYELSRELGRYASRTRMVELFVNTTGGALNGPAPLGDYNGVYVLMEKIKRSDERVNIARLEVENNKAPLTSGGYLLKVDSADSDERTFNAGDLDIVYQYPDGLEMVTAQRSTQATYIRNFLNSFYAALTGPNANDPRTGYLAYIDEASWIDHHILNVLAMNADAFRLSAYFFKNRYLQLEMGPIWDFDRAMGTSDWGDLRPFSPVSWMASNGLGGGGDYGTDFFNPGNVFHNPWYSVAFTFPDFWQLWIDRYQELRDGPFATAHLNALVDGYREQLREAQPREEQRWPDMTAPRMGTVSVPGYSYDFPGTYDGEMAFLKTWLRDRAGFIDGQLLARPTVSRPFGQITAGTSVTLSGPAGATIYYTLNGTDPRASGGSVAAGALTYTGPITLNTNARLVARARDPNHHNLTGPGNPPISSPWSGVVSGTYVVGVPGLVITELMYHPPEGVGVSTNGVESFEYVELKNVSGGVLGLGGFRLGGGIEYVMPATNLVAGGRVVVVADVGAYVSRYGSGGGVMVLGPYSGRLGNDGDRVVLEGPLGEPILDFEYRDGWYPMTDGLGYSLGVVNEGAERSQWGWAGQWRATGPWGGSPGFAEVAVGAVGTVVISEALTHTDLPQVDSVELRNVGTEEVDIGGWYLSDSFDWPWKYKVGAGTRLGPGGYRVLSESDFGVGPEGFLLRSVGDQVYLFSSEVGTTNLTGYVQGYEYGAAQNGVSFIRHVNSVGKEEFVAQAGSPTLGSANGGPRVGPVVINEVQYWPGAVYGTNNNTRDEYVELYNAGAQEVGLYDPGHPTNRWQLRGAVEYEFEPGTRLAANGYLVVVGFDPVWQPGELAAFRSRYGLGTGVAVVGPYRGQLANEGESVRLYQPDPPQTVPGPDYGMVPYVLVERVDYEVGNGWPTNVLGSGRSLQRVTALGYGNEPLNWQGADPTPGRANAVSGGEQDRDGDGMPDSWESLHGLDPGSGVGESGAAGDPDRDGVGNLAEYWSGTDPQDGGSYLALESIGLGNGGSQVRLRFLARAGKTYSILQRAQVPGTGPWTKLIDIPAQSADGQIDVPDPNAPVSPQRYYRLVTPSQP